jgi:small subunit ribosomal protein S6
VNAAAVRIGGRTDPALGDQEVDTEIEKLSQLLSEGEGEVKEVQRWGRRKIAYEIRGKGEGHYTLLRFMGEPGLIAGFERACRLNELILRHLVLKA